MATNLALTYIHQVVIFQVAVAFVYMCDSLVVNGEHLRDMLLAECIKVIEHFSKAVTVSWEGRSDVKIETVDDHVILELLAR